MLAINVHNYLRKNCKGAFIIYVDRGYDDFEGGSLFLPTMIKGGLWKIPNQNDIEHRGGADKFFFPEKEKEMKICCWTLLKFLSFISFRQNIDAEPEYET